MISLPDAYIIRNTKPNHYFGREVVLAHPKQTRTFVVAAGYKLAGWSAGDILPPLDPPDRIRATHIPDTNCFLEEL